MQQLQKNSIDWSTQMSRMTENLSTIQLSQILYDETAQASKPTTLVPPCVALANIFSGFVWMRRLHFKRTMPNSRTS